MMAMTIRPGATTAIPSVIAPALWAPTTARAGGDNDEQERPPSFSENAPPFERAVQKIVRCPPLNGALHVGNVWHMAVWCRHGFSLSAESIANGLDLSPRCGF